ncbi:MAG: SH3 domain-containing protein [Lachnospiraceae bacterium]|nr:SH3 domain-containing protein [Lachnospiraceae bacterium]
MNKKEQMKEKLHSFVEWCKDIGGLIKENRMIAIAVVVFVAIVIIAVAVSTAIGKNSQSSEVAAAIVETENSTEEETLVVPDDPLETDAYPEVNALVKKYYQAMADGDLETLSGIMTGLDEKEQIKITKKSEYVENYPTVICYTKKGPLEDSYIVYAYYEVKLVDFENLTPGMNALYVCKNDAGAYYINGETQDDKTIDYCEMISAQDDVVDLVNTVQVKYNELKSVDTELCEFLAQLPDILTAAVGEELAKLEAEENASVEEPAEETQEPEETEEPVEEAAETVIKTVRTTDVVNVRSSDSATADKIGKAQKGEEYTLLEEKGNGWSKVMYDGKEAYIKTEFLQVVSEETVEASNSENSEAADNSPVSGTATVTDTVNIRTSASTSAEKLGVCYPGDKLEIIMKQADGWTKVKFKNKTGYVKSEFLE